jgi:uncharacterized integral membrane protein (TIGR00697 family)
MSTQPAAMPAAEPLPAAPLSIPRALFVFSIFYGGMVCIAGVLANKQIALGPLAVEAGIFAFLLLVVVSSTIAELYGRQQANALVRFGFIPLIASILLMLLVHRLPDAMHERPGDLGHIQAILGQSPRVMVAGIIAYGTSQTLNVMIFSRLRNETGRLLWLRAGVASVLSQIIDTVLFITISFYKEFPIGSLLLGQMVAKVVLSAVIVPPLIYLFVGLGRRLDGRA